MYNVTPIPSVSLFSLIQEIIIKRSADKEKDSYFAEEVDGAAQSFDDSTKEHLNELDCFHEETKKKEVEEQAGVETNYVIDPASVQAQGEEEETGGETDSRIVTAPLQAPVQEKKDGAETPATTPNTPEKTQEDEENANAEPAFEAHTSDAGAENQLGEHVQVTQESQQKEIEVFTGLSPGTTLDKVRVLVERRWKKPSLVCFKGTNETTTEVIAYPATLNSKFHVKDVHLLHEKPLFLPGESVYVVLANSIVKAEVTRLLSLRKKEGGPCFFNYSVKEDGNVKETIYSSDNLVAMYKEGSMVLLDGVHVGVVVTAHMCMEDPWTVNVEVIDSLIEILDHEGNKSFQVNSSTKEVDLRKHQIVKV